MGEPRVRVQRASCEERGKTSSTAGVVNVGPGKDQVRTVSGNKYELVISYPNLNDLFDVDQLPRVQVDSNGVRSACAIATGGNVDAGNHCSLRNTKICLKLGADCLVSHVPNGRFGGVELGDGYKTRTM
jgi:hypothetical protein